MKSWEGTYWGGDEGTSREEIGKVDTFSDICIKSLRIKKSKSEQILALVTSDDQLGLYLPHYLETY